MKLRSYLFNSMNPVFNDTHPIFIWEVYHGHDIIHYHVINDVIMLLSDTIVRH